MRHLTPIETIAGEALDHTNPDRRARRGGSRRSVWRDGLAAQTVIEKLENVRSYRAFERAIIASIEPRLVIELELGHRLASLLWRLRRASMIETGLLEIQGELLLARRTRSESETVLSPIRVNGHNQNLRGSHERPGPKFSRAIAQCFANLDPVLLERVGTYEARLWRQAAQTIWTLEAMRHPAPALTRRRFHKPIESFFWMPTNDSQHHARRTA